MQPGHLLSTRPQANTSQTRGARIPAGNSGPWRARPPMQVVHTCSCPRLLVAAGLSRHTCTPPRGQSAGECGRAVASLCKHRSLDIEVHLPIHFRSFCRRAGRQAGVQADRQSVSQSVSQSGNKQRRPLLVDRNQICHTGPRREEVRGPLSPGHNFMWGTSTVAHLPLEVGNV